MSQSSPLAVLAVALAIAAPPLRAADNAELDQLRREIDAMRQSYEARLNDLEARLRQAEAGLAAPPAPASASPSTAAAATPLPPAPRPEAEIQLAAPAQAGGFNPAVSLVLSGSYASLSKDPANYRFAGILTGNQIGPGAQGFSLGESELGLSANVDPWFFGALNLALAADNTASVEEAYIQTTALPNGLTLRAGRFLSGIGYNNERHAHTWDFADAPLVYQAFLDGALKQDGLQLRLLLPTSQFVELGSELGAAGPFPTGGPSRNRPATAALFAHTGGDVGDSQSWRAGLSVLWARADGRTSDALDATGQIVAQSFTGNSRLAILDGVWKWAPGGNPQRTNLTLQGEYFRRLESGSLVVGSTGQTPADSFRATQGGWYAQAVYQFIPAWRVGMRYDRLDVGNVDAAGNTANLYLPRYSPTRSTLMVDWSPSEFSRVRLQLAQDKARYGLTDNQILVQYQMSLGSHGAHNY